MAANSRLPKELRCAEATRLLSPYLDGAVTGAEMQAVQRHLAVCRSCAGEYCLLQNTQQMLAGTRRLNVPADLGLKLRLAVSREAARKRRPYEGFRVRLENTLKTFMVPATAGLACAVLIFGLVAAILATPDQLQANNQDVPLVLNTGPEPQQGAFSTQSSIEAGSLVVEAYIDSQGRIDDYRVLSDPGNSKELLPQVKRMLIFTTFRPAMSMGRPISSRAVLSFSRINGRG